MATDTEVAAGMAEAAGNAAEKAGMPQLDFATFPNQVFWLVLVLVAIYLILSRIAVPRIGGILAERQATITNDIALADAMKARAVDAEKAYNQALIDARAEANRIVAAAKAEIQKGLDAATATADAQIAAKTAESTLRIDEIRAGATEAVTEVARDATAEIVAALGGKTDSKSVAAAVTARLKG